MSLTIGDLAPAFTMQASGGRTVESAALHGQPYVLYFYPKADTPGCTTEACNFQEALPQFAGAGVTVIGVSKDPIKKIETFAGKFGLRFTLASDQSNVCEAFGVWVEKSMYGRTYMGIERATFLIDADGRIARVWRNVKVPGHAADVLAAGATI